MSNRIFPLFLLIFLILASVKIQAQDQKLTSKTAPQPKKYSLNSSKIGTNGFADIVEALTPAVVNISTSKIVNIQESKNNLGDIFDHLPKDLLDNFSELLKNNNLEQEEELLSLGSGFIISKDGYIVSNYHVIDDAQDIEVKLSDSRSFKAKVIGVDERTDLALLKINTKTDLPFVKFGNSEKSRIGEWVIAIGNPFGLGGSVSVGIISANNRDINSGKSDNYIQTDAAINKGNSGGPLFNIKGEVIGVATAIFSPSGGNIGIGFATPANIASETISELKEKGQITRGWIGVSVQNITAEIAEAIGLKNNNGALIVEIIKNGPAEKAKILATDIIIEFDGQKIIKMKDLPKIVAKTKVGKKVKIKLIRKGKIKTVKIKVEKLDEDQVQEILNPKIHNKSEEIEDTILKMGLVTLNNKIRNQHKIDKNIKGLFIAEIDNKSEAYKKSIRKGDVILSVNQKILNSTSDLNKIIKNLKKDNKKSILLLIKRDQTIKSDNFVQKQSYSFTTTLSID